MEKPGIWVIVTTFVVFPLLIALLQYYGFPLLDKCSVVLWRSLRTRMESRQKRRAAEYQKMVQNLIRNEHCQLVMREFVTHNYIAAYAYSVTADIAFLALLLLLNTSSNPAPALPYIEQLARVLPFLAAFDFSVWRSHKGFSTARTTLKALDDAYEQECRRTEGTADTKDEPHAT